MVVVVVMMGEADCLPAGSSRAGGGAGGGCRHEYYFEVTAVSSGSESYTYQLKADKEDEMQNWVKQIQLQVCMLSSHTASPPSLSRLL